MMLDIVKIDTAQTECVVTWHKKEPTKFIQGFLGIVLEQHWQNFQLWHEEDEARSVDVGDHIIAQVKRNIDRFNQKRNDLIEKMDDSYLKSLDSKGIQMNEKAPFNSETLGSMIDRCSILALKFFHMQEQTIRKDVTDMHILRSKDKVNILQIQRQDLLSCITKLTQEIKLGVRQYKIYRQFKMYNDPNLNPAMYRTIKKD